MKNTTNILLMVVIVLLVALLVDKRIDNNTLRADSGGAIDKIIFAVDPITKDRFYMVHTENHLVTYYEYDQGKQGILLKAARQFDYDSKIQGNYKPGSAQGDSFEVTKSIVENAAKPKNK